jgi:mono/diheme cytochrome c family protein
VKWCTASRVALGSSRRTHRRLARALGAVATLVAPLDLGVPASASPVPTVGSDETAAFVGKYCVSCHDSEGREAGLDLESLKFSLDDPDNFLTWVKVHDRLRAGEMPPGKRKRPGRGELDSFLAGLAGALTAREQQSIAAEGRVTQRRLNRYEYENAVRDLLQAPWLQVKEQLPEDGETYRFNKSAAGLDVSHVHMSRYLAAADRALRDVLTVQFLRPETTKTRYHARDENSLTRFRPSIFTPAVDRLTFPLLGTKGQTDVRTGTAPRTVGDADPGTREQEAVGWTHGNYVTGFGSGWRNFRAPVAGRYRLRFSGYTIWVGPGGRVYHFAGERDRVGKAGEPQWFRPNADDVSPGRRYEPITIYAKGGTQNRRLGGFDLTTEPAVHELGEVWLLANEFIVTDACRFFRSRPGGPGPVDWQNPLARTDGQPGVAFRWMEVEGPIYDDSTAAGYRLLFGDLPVEKVASGGAGVTIKLSEAGRGRVAKEELVEVLSTDVERDAERLLRRFMESAYRRPVAENEVQRYLALIHDQLRKQAGFAGAMLAGYTAVLSSPGFLFIEEKPGRLDDHALATRLALFLWNSPPDQALRARASRGELHDPKVLRAETERLLADPRSNRFVEAFLDYWLDLRKLDETTPSTTLYSDYYLDDALAEAALEETRRYFADLLRWNLPARNIVASNFTYLNDRLAAHYGIPGVKGIAMRRVTLPADSPRGGLMTQASVLKVTANGTTTSPVLRGKWITNRILGLEIRPPPPSVKAVEPDIRGAVTIRQQLDKHRADPSCSVCHSKMDPPGFALEAFDVMGGWRDRYRAAAEDRSAEPGIGMNGWRYTFHHALPVDSAGELPDGRAFKDVRQFKRLLLTDQKNLARSFTRQLVVYATGAPVRFSDRPRIESILQSAKATNYGIRSLVHGIVQSDLFLNK